MFILRGIKHTLYTCCTKFYPIPTHAALPYLHKIPSLYPNNLIHSHIVHLSPINLLIHLNQNSYWHKGLTSAYTRRPLDTITHPFPFAPSMHAWQPVYLLSTYTWSDTNVCYAHTQHHSANPPTCSAPTSTNTPMVQRNWGRKKRNSAKPLNMTNTGQYIHRSPICFSISHFIPFIQVIRPFGPDSSNRYFFLSTLLTQYLILYLVLKHNTAHKLLHPDTHHH